MLTRGRVDTNNAAHPDKRRRELLMAHPQLPPHTPCSRARTLWPASALQGPTVLEALSSKKVMRRSHPAAST